MDRRWQVTQHDRRSKMEKSLAQIAREEFLAPTYTTQDTYERVAKEVEAEVLKRLNKSEAEPVAEQELSFVQVAQWVDRHGSTKGLQWRDNGGNWRDADATVIPVSLCYRVAPKKVNDPDDPTTWEKGVAIFRRDSEDDAWILDVFKSYLEGCNFKYHTEHCGRYKYAKLATPEQVAAWKLINDDL